MEGVTHPEIDLVGPCQFSLSKHIMTQMAGVALHSSLRSFTGGEQLPVPANRQEDDHGHHRKEDCFAYAVQFQNS